MPSQFLIALKCNFRFDVAQRPAAAICTGFLNDLIAAGYMPSNSSNLAVDGKKMYRAKEKVMASSKEVLRNRMQIDPIRGIFFDGKNDKHTKVLIFDEETNRRYPSEISEEHYTVTWEPSGKYLFHFSPEKPSEKQKPAKMIASGIYYWFDERDATEELVMIRGDSTSTITGSKGEAIHYLEVMLGRKCHWLICLIHINELPLKHLISSLDGKYIPKSGWTGPIGKLIQKINDLKKKPSFPALTDTNEMIEIPQEILKNMSTDQKNCYNLIAVVKSGRITPEQAKIKCGPLSTARWLTTGQSLVMLWMSEHGLTGESLRILELLVRFCINMYFKLYYDIKVHPRIKDAPLHLTSALKLLHQQPNEVKKIITDVIKRGAYSAHSENLLASFISSDDKKLRKFAVEKILDIRKGKEAGDKSVRYRQNPQVKLEAQDPLELIDWKKEEILEPIFTTDLKIDEIKKLVETPFPMESYNTHTQSCERAVQEVSKSSEAVYGEDKRDGWVRARIDHREILPVFNSKKDIVKTMN